MPHTQNTPPDAPSIQDEISRLDDDGGAPPKTEGNQEADKATLSKAELDTWNENSTKAGIPA